MPMHYGLGVSDAELYATALEWELHARRPLRARGVAMYIQDRGGSGWGKQLAEAGSAAAGSRQRPAVGSELPIQCCLPIPTASLLNHIRSSERRRIDGLLALTQLEVNLRLVDSVRCVRPWR